MSTITTAVRRAATVLLTGTLLVAVAGSTASASEGGKGGQHSKARSTNSANSGCGEYCSTRDGSPSRNGNGDGKATGRPCAGCVGKADNKNPHGQRPNGSDSNNGYECDGNSGIARSNPAHTGCTAPAPVAVPSGVSAVADEVAPPAVAPVTPKVLGTALHKAAGPAAAADAVPVGALGAVAPQVLGTTFTRTTVAGSTGTQGTLPFTGGETTGLILAALALLLTGVVAVRAAAAVGSR